MEPGQLLRGALLVAFAGLLAAALIVVLKPILVRYVLAHPNARSSHARATPQGAGVGVILALAAVCGAATFAGSPPEATDSLAPVLAAALGLMLIGLIDDARPLPVSLRFGAQGLAAFAMLYSLPDSLRILPDLLPLAVERALLLVGTVYFINAINFLDGIDWITAAQVVPMSLGIAVLAGMGAVPRSAGLLALVLLGVMLGFAYFNKHPAQVFLGDAGSLPIGLLLAYLLIHVAGIDLAAALLLSLYTIADSGITLARRAYRREPIFQAHRTHFYQRAVIAGLTPPKVTARIFALGLLLAALAILAVALRSPLTDALLLLVGMAATGLLLVSLSAPRT